MLTSQTRLGRLLAKTPARGWVRLLRARRQLARWTPHDDEMKAFYRRFIAPGDVCFDVGANVGNRTKIFLALGARVVAVEPQRECTRVLRAGFARNRGLTVVEKAVGASEGTAEIQISDASEFSSLSADWIGTVRSGRFRERSWHERRTVAVTSLDRLIAEFGRPSFVKIDVEGFEHEVVKGLSCAVPALSLEFAPESLEIIFRCFDHLASLGEIRLNYSLAESMRMAHDAWVDQRAMVEILTRLGKDHTVWGDVYVRTATA